MKQNPNIGENKMKSNLSHDEASRKMFFGKSFIELTNSQRRIIISKLGEPEDYRSKTNYPDINDKYK